MASRGGPGKTLGGPGGPKGSQRLLGESWPPSGGLLGESRDVLGGLEDAGTIVGGPESVGPGKFLAGVLGVSWRGWSWGGSMGETQRNSTGWSWGESWGMFGVLGGVVKGYWESCEGPGQMLADVWLRGSDWIPSVCACFIWPSTGNGKSAIPKELD